MERETTSITLPISKSVVVLYSYITGREKRALANALLGSVGSIGADASSMGNIKPEMLDKAQNLAFTTIIESFDGHKDGDALDGGTQYDLVGAVLDLRAGDYQAVVDKVNEITSDKGFLA